MAIPVGAVQRRLAEADRTVLYVQAMPGQRDQARADTEAGAASAPAAGAW